MRRIAVCSRTPAPSCTRASPTGWRAGWATPSSTTRRSAGTSSRRTRTCASWALSTSAAAPSESGPRATSRPPAAAPLRATTCHWRPPRPGAALPRAARLLGRALERLESADPARADLTLDWCEALLAAGDVAPAAPAIDQLAAFAGESARLRAWHTCFAGQLAALTDPQALRATADAVAAAADVL